MKRNIILLSVLMLFLPFILISQELSADEEHTHNELRALHAQVLTALDNNQIDEMLTYLHPEVVYTAMNQKVCRGRDQVKAYFDHMLKGENSVVKEFKIAMEVDTLTVLYGGDTGIAYGSSVESYVLNDGDEFTVNNRWTATLIKEKGKWLVAAIHSSSNIFDNPILDHSVKITWWTGGVATLVGLTIGYFIGK